MGTSVVSQPLDRSLDISLGPEIRAPSAEHRLLVGFHFGQPGARPDEFAMVDTGLVPIGARHSYECWWHRGDVGFRRHGDVRIVEGNDLAVLILQRPAVASEPFHLCIYGAYRELLRAIGTIEHRNLVKIWNYFPAINEGEGDTERYRQFSIGRAEAFEEIGLSESGIPAGTAVGCRDVAVVTIIAIVSRQKFHSAENPRQVSAYRYPRQYGPRSPKFSRGGVVRPDGQDLFVISGTASIVGHETKFPFAVPEQIEETIRNLESMFATLSALPVASQDVALDPECVLRVYLRNAQDRPLVAKALSQRIGSGRNIAYLAADICRRELMVEVDAVRSVA